LKRIVRLQSGETITSDEIGETGDFPVFGGGGLRGFTSNFTHDGEFALIGRQGALCGNINYGCGRFWASEHALVATPIRPLHTRWLGELLRAMNLNQYSVSAAQPGLSVDIVGRLRIVVPPLPEQSAIAAFLDRETTRIDALIAEQQRLMELLQEKRQAVISHAVTKGLNPDAPMKPSGVEWLGDVPAHWLIRPLKYSITRIEQGWSPQCEGSPAESGEWGVLKVGCVNGDDFCAREQKALPSDVSPLPEYEIGPGDIIMSRGNTLELVGMAAFVREVRPQLLLSDLLYRFRARPESALGEFITLSLRSPHVRFQIERAATGTSASMKKIGQSVIREFLIALPPLEEQRGIVSRVRSATLVLDRLLAETGLAIDLLRERRAALITAAVTGQIEVRGVAISEAA